MKRASHVRRLVVGILVATATFISGCTLLGGVQSTPTAYFLLTAATDRPAESEPRPLTGLVVGIGPVTVPDYLDRPQIVTRFSENRLMTDDFALWAEPFKTNVSRVVAENVAFLSAADDVLLFPWRTSLRVDRQVAIDVIHFERKVNGPVILSAQWTIDGAGGQEGHSICKETIVEAVAGGGYDSMAAAMSRALEALSHRIVCGLSNLHEGCCGTEP